MTTDNKVAIAGADFITIAVKPKVVKKVIDEIKPLVDYENQMIVNMAASISIAQLSQWSTKTEKAPDGGRQKSSGPSGALGFTLVKITCGAYAVSHKDENKSAQEFKGTKMH